MKYFTLVILFMAFLAIGCSTAYKSLAAQTPNLAVISNGIYRGHYDVSSTPVKATLDITIQNHRITEIQILEHYCSSIGKKAEKITDLVIEHQRLDIDVISGATISSKAILKAIENALQ